MKAVTDVIAFLILPPSGPLLVLIAGIVLAPRRKRLGLALASLAAAVLWISSMAAVGNGLLRSLEPAPFPQDAAQRVDAIVVLGGGMIVDSPEYRENVPSSEALARVRYAARLARQSGLPVLLAGGNPYGGTASEAQAMASALREFGIEVRWKEERSITTAESAVQAFALLAPERRTRIALVTTAWHMPRAERAFAKAGFRVVPAATSYTAALPLRVVDFLPTAPGLSQTRVALWELLGLAWYRIRGAI